VRDSLSTQELGWVLGRSANSIRDDIRSGAIESTRIPSGFRIPKAEALRLAREKVEGDAERSRRTRSWNASSTR
jgi:hypothetical protein